jgi:hypothetical protein
VFSGAGSLLSNAGRRVIDGFVNGLQSGYQRVRDTLSRLTGLLPDWKGPASRDRKILKKSGQLVIGGFQAGLESKYGAVRSSLSSFTGSLSAGPGALTADFASVSPRSTATTAQPIVLSFEATGDPLMDAVFEAMRKRIRIKGGNVQAVLGQ